MMYNRLWGMRVYLAGPMDRVADGGIEWREQMTPFLESLGMVVLNPCDKPINIGVEEVEERQHRKKWKKEKNWKALAEQMKLIRATDLRMVDQSDVMIMHLDADVHMCGSYEEDSWANRCKNPILVHCEQGKAGCPDWMFGKIPHQHIFSLWENLRAYLVYVDEYDGDVEHMKRWMFFDYTRMMPKVPPRFNTDWRPW